MTAPALSARSARRPSARAHARRGRPGEQGSAMLVVATILIALLAGGGIALFLQLQSTRSTALTKSGRESLYCSEAGLAAAQGFLTNQIALWPLLLDANPANDPAWYPLRGSMSGGLGSINLVTGTFDYEVRIKDNDDEVAPTPNDPTHDLDSRVFMISRCLQNPEVPREVVQLIDVAASGHNYRNQANGGAGATGNQN